MPRYVALLRGINVGGRNPIKMADLRECFEAHGFEDVATYIQSGNVLFGSIASGSAELTSAIERMLTDRFDFEASIVLRSRAQIRAVVEEAPEGFGVDDAYRSDVIFLKPARSATAALAELPQREGVDRAWAGRGVLFVDRVAERAAQSRLSKIASLPMYRDLTIRNWRTTTELVRLLS